jgi:hypothetical protein
MMKMIPWWQGLKKWENENDSCMKRVKQLEKGDDKYMKIIKYLEKKNDIYRVRDKFFIYALLFVIVCNVVGCLCCTC